MPMRLSKLGQQPHLQTNAQDTIAIANDACASEDSASCSRRRAGIRAGCGSRPENGQAHFVTGH